MSISSGFATYRGADDAPPGRQSPMKVVVSSPATFVFKFVAPVVWGGLWSCGTTLLLLAQTKATFSVRVWSFDIVKDHPVSWGGWASLGFLFLGGVVFRAVAFPLKRVALEGDHLLISNFVREISVPFTAVYAGGFDGGEINHRSLVVLVFRAPTSFGKSIKFVPASKESLSLLRARLRPELGAEVDPEAEAIAAELRGRGTA